MIDLTPGSPEWTKRVTASKVAAILGRSPFASPRSVWHQMHGDLPLWEGSDATRRGQFLEAGVLAWWRHKHGIGSPDFMPEVWSEQPTYTLGDWAAATPDAVAAIGTDGEADWRRVLVDAKTTSDFDWVEVPVHYYAQALWAMHVSGIHEFRFAVLHGNLRFQEYVVEYDADLAAGIEAKCREFYDSLAADEPPPLDDTTFTYEAVRKVHPDIEPKAAVELDFDTAYDLAFECESLKVREARARLAKSAVLDRMGRAQYATHNGVRIARRQNGAHGVTFVVIAKPSDLNDLRESA